MLILNTRDSEKPWFIEYIGHYTLSLNVGVNFVKPRYGEEHVSFNETKSIYFWSFSISEKAYVSNLTFTKILQNHFSNVLSLKSQLTKLQLQ